MERKLDANKSYKQTTKLILRANSRELLVSRQSIERLSSPFLVVVNSRVHNVLP